MKETERNPLIIDAHHLIIDAHHACRDAIVENLGRDPEHSDLIEVIKHIAYNFITDFQTSDVEGALDDAAIFKAILVKSIEETQETVA